MRTITVSGLEKPVSVIGLGTMVFHPKTQGRDSGLLDEFVRCGGTFIDTAEVYGAVEEHGYSEMVIGTWLSSNPDAREKIVLSTKGLIPGYCRPLYPGGAKIDPAYIHKAIEGSLGRLKTSFLDMWMFHRDDPSIPVGPLVDALDEEVRAGRIKAYGASNWTTARIEEAVSYARVHGKTPMMAASDNFSLALANEPYWPNTVFVTEADRAWLSDNNFLLVAWSALGRGFFSHGDPTDHSDPDLVRTFYSAGNFKRKQRAEEFAQQKGLTMFQVALAYVLNQNFPVVALNGAQTKEHIANSAAASEVRLTAAECAWLDLSSDVRPF